MYLIMSIISLSSFVAHVFFKIFRFFVKKVSRYLQNINLTEENRETLENKIILCILCLFNLFFLFIGLLIYDINDNCYRHILFILSLFLVSSFNLIIINTKYNNIKWKKYLIYIINNKLKFVIYVLLFTRVILLISKYFIYLSINIDLEVTGIPSLDYFVYAYVFFCSLISTLIIIHWLKQIPLLLGIRLNLKGPCPRNSRKNKKVFFTRGVPDFSILNIKYSYNNLIVSFICFSLGYFCTGLVLNLLCDFNMELLWGKLNTFIKFNYNYINNNTREVLSKLQLTLKFYNNKILNNTCKLEFHEIKVNGLKDLLQEINVMFKEFKLIWPLYINNLMYCNDKYLVYTGPLCNNKISNKNTLFMDSPITISSDSSNNGTSSEESDFSDSNRAVSNNPRPGQVSQPSQLEIEQAYHRQQNRNQFDNRVMERVTRQIETTQERRNSNVSQQSRLIAESSQQSTRPHLVQGTAEWIYAQKLQKKWLEAGNTGNITDVCKRLAITNKAINFDDKGVFINKPFVDIYTRQTSRSNNPEDIYFVNTTEHARWCKIAAQHIYINNTNIKENQALLNIHFRTLIDFIHKINVTVAKDITHNRSIPAELLNTIPEAEDEIAHLHRAIAFHMRNEVIVGYDIEKASNAIAYYKSLVDIGIPIHRVSGDRELDNVKQAVNNLEMLLPQIKKQSLDYTEFKNNIWKEFQHQRLWESYFSSFRKPKNAIGQ